MIKLLGKEVKIYETDNFLIPFIDPFFLKRSKAIVKTILELKHQVGFEKLLYIPGISDPYLVPHLFLLGVDVFDSINATIEGIHGTEYTMFGRTKSDKINLGDTNIKFLSQMIYLLGRGVSSMSLMEIVERWNISSKGREIVRVLYDNYGEDFESVYPRVTSSVIAGGLESLKRPDILRFNKFIQESYRKPNEVETLLFLPCSARKPYSKSKSHQALFEALGNFRKYVNEVIVTSPICLVPRELEETYPAGFYDIPVTGSWYREEEENIIFSIRSFLKNNDYKNIIFFLPEDLFFLKEHFGNIGKFLLWKKGSDNEFQELTSYIENNVNRDNHGKKRDFIFEKLKAISEYQFGSWLEEYVDELKVNRMFNQFMLVKENKPYFIYNERQGKLTIHKNAAHIFLKENKFLVEIDDFKPTANVYAMGIKNCSNEIRQEDEIVMHFNGDIRGTGIAKMSPEIMLNSKKGIGIKVRN
jgi:archaeosine synthase